MSEFQTFLKDKPYEFVPLLEKCKRIKYTSHNILENDTYNGRLKLKIIVESSLHIGGKQQDYDKKEQLLSQAAALKEQFEQSQKLFHIAVL